MTMLSHGTQGCQWTSVIVFFGLCGLHATAFGPISHAFDALNNSLSLDSRTHFAYDDVGFVCTFKSFANESIALLGQLRHLLDVGKMGKMPPRRCLHPSFVSFGQKI